MQNETINGKTVDLDSLSSAELQALEVDAYMRMTQAAGELAILREFVPQEIRQMFGGDFKITEP